MKLNPIKWPLHYQIILSLFFGVILGVIIQNVDSLQFLLFGFKLGGTIFLKLLKMVIIPLVVSSLFLGITSASSLKELGSMGSKTGIYYLCSSLLAILIGLLFVNVMQPGVGANISLDAAAPVAHTAMKHQGSLWDILARVIPQNPIDSLAKFDMMGIIFFTIIFAIFSLKITKPKRQTLDSFAKAVNDVMLYMVEAIIKLAPLGVFCLIVKLVAETGFDTFMPLLKYIFTVSLALGAHFFIVLPVIYALFTKKNPFTYMKAMAPALLTAFSSASSAATLPLTMECAEESAGLLKKVTSLVFPLGATVNMDGTALYEGVAVLFLAQALNIDLSITQQFTVLITGLLVSVGAAGIPHAGLVMMVIILEAVGLPLEATGILLAVDRFVDMGRTAVNVWSDSVGAAIINHGVVKQSFDK